MSELRFELWLEFEHWQSTRDDDLENDFFNMHIHTSDGKRYALNVWTYRVLQHAVEKDRQNGKNLNGKYQLPPDLFYRSGCGRANSNWTTEKGLANPP
jgi:hypothetical protein